MSSHAFLVVGILCGILLVNTPTVDSTLWDLIITTNIVNAPIFTQDSIAVSGIVVDHASMPIENANIQIRIGSEKVLTTTSPAGVFYYELKDLDLIAGFYVINVVATDSDGKFGISNTEFQVKGPNDFSSHTAKLLEAPEAQEYLYADESDFNKDPIGLVLFSYYQDLQIKFEEEQARQLAYDENDKVFDDIRQISEDLTQQIIDQENPGAGTYSGMDKAEFLDNLDPEIKEIFVQQLSYTIDLFLESQKVMEHVLQNGGTMEEARMAYFENVGTPRELLENLTLNEKLEILTDQEIPESTESIIIESETVEDVELVSEIEDENLSVDVDGTEIKVGLSGTTIYLEINGTMVEFLIDGNEIIQVTNSTKNE